MLKTNPLPHPDRGFTKSGAALGRGEGASGAPGTQRRCLVIKSWFSILKNLTIGLTSVEVYFR